MEGNTTRTVLNSETYYDLLIKLGKQNFSVPDSLWEYFIPLYKSDLEDRYSSPMKFIGVYIAVASLCCIVAMLADLVHGIKNKKLWFPCRRFTINALSLTGMAVAMKLPVDLTGYMPGVVDQIAKLGSLAFMCTMMANSLPSLATMDKKTLLANVVALGVLVITMVVNVCIQIFTGVVDSKREYVHKIVDILRKREFPELLKHAFSEGDYPELLRVLGKVRCSQLAAVYVGMLLILLIIYVCSSLAILKSKQIIEHAYQKDDVQQSTLTVAELQQYVSRYWILAGSPQFTIACYETTTVAGVICVLTTFFHSLTIGWTIGRYRGGHDNYGSNYGKSMLAILIVQYIGVIIGTSAPICRCISSLGFKVTFDSVLKHIKVFTVESYWTQQLLDWKSDSIRFRIRNHKRNVVLKNLKSLIFHLSVILQKVVVVVCKIIVLIPIFVRIFIFACVWFLKWVSDTVFCSSRKSTDQNSGQLKYVLPLEIGMEFNERLLHLLTGSMNRLIERGEKKQPNNLMNLIKEKSAIGFQGVKKLDNNDNQDSWSLKVVNLTTIVITLRMIKKVKDDSLLKSVREGLEYVTFVEKILKTTDDYVSIRKAAETLWEKVDCDHKWLGIKLKDITVKNTDDCQEDATMEIVKLFFEKAEKIKNDEETKKAEKIKKAEENKKGEKIKNKGVESTDGGGLDGDSKFRSICANSMSSITKTIIDDQKESQKKSFDELISSRIAEIIVECLTNLPQAIIKKCYTDVIEKREKSVKEAAQILGETKEIIKILNEHSRHVPSMDPDNVLL